MADVGDVIRAVSDGAYNVIYTPKRRQIVIIVHKDRVKEFVSRLSGFRIEVKESRRGVLASIRISL